MTNFVLVYQGGGMAATEAEQAASMQAWGKWFAEVGSALVDGGNPFIPTSKSITGDGTISINQGDSVATGYSIVQAASLDAAVTLAQGCPILREGGRVSVYETFQVM